MHIISSPPQMPSEYAEVTQSILPKTHHHSHQHQQQHQQHHQQQHQQQQHHQHYNMLNNQQAAPPEPYATVTLQRGAQSDDSCIKCSSASPSSSEYNAPVREPVNLCDMLPPPPDHPYGTYGKPPAPNMTIRTNPAAMSPQIGRRAVPPTPSRQQQQPQWVSPGGQMPPPIPTFPHNWNTANSQQQQHQQLQQLAMMPTDVDNNQHLYIGGDADCVDDCDLENDYESGSVLYEQCCRPNVTPSSSSANNTANQMPSAADSRTAADAAAAAAAAAYFMRGGEPTEEYYRNINMEYLDEHDFEPSTPPPPCPDTSTTFTGAGRSTHHGGANLRLLGGNGSSAAVIGGGSAADSPLMHAKRGGGSSSSRLAAIGAQSQQQQPMMHTSGSTSTTQSAHSSDSDSETSRWAPAQRTRRSRSRSKSGDRKYLRGGIGGSNVGR